MFRPGALLSADIRRIFLCNILIDFNAATSTVESIASILSGARDPEFFVSLYVKVVGLESRPLQALEFSPAIVERFACLGKVDSTNSGLSA